MVRDSLKAVGCGDRNLDDGRGLLFRAGRGEAHADDGGRGVERDVGDGRVD